MSIDQAVYDALPDEAKAEIDSLREDNDKKSGALKEMREENKNLKQGVDVLDDNTKKELEELRTFKTESEKKLADAEQQKAVEKGEFDKVLADKEAQIEKLTQSSTELGSLVDSYGEVFRGLIQSKIDSIPEDKKESVNMVLKNTPMEQRFAVLDEFVSLYSGGKKPVDPKAPGKKTDASTDSDYRRAVDGRDIQGALRTAPNL